MPRTPRDERDAGEGTSGGRATPGLNFLGYRERRADFFLTRNPRDRELLSHVTTECHALIHAAWFRIRRSCAHAFTHSLTSRVCRDAICLPSASSPAEPNLGRISPPHLFPPTLRPFPLNFLLLTFPRPFRPPEPAYPGFTILASQLRARRMALPTTFFPSPQGLTPCVLST